jgi:microcystin-dependent protein
MAEPFLGQIIQVAFNFAPRGYAMCNGQLLPISQNEALYALLGTTFGGDGVSSFALPNLQGRIPLHQGQGPGLTNRVMGAMAGEEEHTLISNEMPTHTHIANANSAANQTLPANNLWGGDSTGTFALYSNGTPDSQLSPQAIGVAGGSQPHDNMQPYLVTTFCMAMVGIFPTQN